MYTIDNSRIKLASAAEKNLHSMQKLKNMLNDEWAIEDIKREILKFLELNQNKSTTLQNPWDTVILAVSGSL